MSRSNMIAGGFGWLSSSTLAGPPDNITAFGAKSFRNVSFTLLKACISQ